MLNQLKLLLLACGDIGARVATQINQSHWTVAAMRRSAEHLPSGIQGFSGDISDPSQLKEVLLKTQPDAVIVTMTPGGMSDEGYRQSYVASAQNLCRCLEVLSLSPQVFWASSSAVYGQNKGEWVDETSATQPDGYRGQRLLEAEEILLKSTVSTSIVRFTGVYGPGRERLLQNIRGGKLASNTHPKWTNRIHSDDCAGVLVHLLEKLYRKESLESLYLATDNLPVLGSEMQRQLAVKMGLDLPAESEIGRVSELAGRRCSNQRLRDSGYRFRYSDWKAGYSVLLSKVCE